MIRNIVNVESFVKEMAGTFLFTQNLLSPSGNYGDEATITVKIVWLSFD